MMGLYGIVEMGENMTRRPVVIYPVMLWWALLFALFIKGTIGDLATSIPFVKHLALLDSPIAKSIAWGLGIAVGLQWGSALLRLSAAALTAARIFLCYLALSILALGIFFPFVGGLDNSRESIWSSLIVAAINVGAVVAISLPGFGAASARFREAAEARQRD
jgi:hypothetical protein